MGAESSTDIGFFYSWGNTEGHLADSGYDFNRSSYNLTPGASVDSNLTLDNDGARANVGYPWRIPTEAEYNELFANCDTSWTRVKGVPGVLFTSRLNGAEVFFPAVGYYNGTTLSNYRSRGYYCTTEFLSEQQTKVMFILSSSNPSIISFRRDFGVTIRAVFDPV